MMFRPHRGALSESVEEMVSLNGWNALLDHLEKINDPHGPAFDRTQVSVKRYSGSDPRTGWLATFIVMVGDRPAGFTDTEYLPTKGSGVVERKKNGFPTLRGYFPPLQGYAPLEYLGEDGEWHPVPKELALAVNTFQPDGEFNAWEWLIGQVYSAGSLPPNWSDSSSNDVAANFRKACEARFPKQTAKFAKYMGWE